MECRNKIWSISNSDGWFLKLSYFLLKYTLGFVIRFVWVSEVIGKNNLPKTGPAVVVFNHQSYFDFLCFIAVSPRNIHYLAAEKFFRHPFWKIFMYLTSQIRVDRLNHDKRDLHKMVFEHLRQGKIIGIFPEGTRSPHRNKMLVAFTGAVKYATKANVPIIPVGILGTYDVMSRHDNRPNFKKIIKINIGKPINFSECYNVKLNKRAHRLLTDNMMHTVGQLSSKVYSPHE